MLMERAKGSSSSSSVLAEAIRNGTGPAAIVMRERDLIVGLGCIVASELYGLHVPVVVVCESTWQVLVGLGSTEACELHIDAALPGDCLIRVSPYSAHNRPPTHRSHDMTLDRRAALNGIAASTLALALPITARAQAGRHAGADQAARQPARRRDAGAAVVLQGPEDRRMVRGVGVSMGKAMAAALGVKFEPVEVTWGTAIAALQGNKIDIMFMIDATPERAQAVDFPQTPLLFYSLAVLARDDLAVKSWADLEQARRAHRRAAGQQHGQVRHRERAQGHDPALPRQRRGDRRLPGRARRRGLPVPPAAARGAPAARHAARSCVPTPAQSQASSAAVRKEATSLRRLGRQADRRLLQERPDAEVVRGVPGSASASTPRPRRR